MENENQIIKSKQYVAKKLLLVIKALIIALTITMVCILLFALIIKIIDLSTTTILTINQIIKVISILSAVLYVVKRDNISWRLGCLIGLAYSLFAWLIFGILSNGVILDMKVFYDLIFSSVIGLILSFIVKGVKQI